VAARVARRTGGRGRRGATELRVCERVGLSRDAAAVVLEVSGRRLLLGLGPAQVTLLADLGVADLGATEPAAAGPVAAGPVAAGLFAAASVAPAPSPVDPLVAGPSRARMPVIPVPRTERVGDSTVRMTELPMSRKAIRQLEDGKRRVASPPVAAGTGSVLDPRTWRQGLEALRDLTARRG
jgi:hypothetical protein